MKFQLTYCPGCLQNQLVIDRLQEENVRLKARWRYQERTAKEGPFDSAVRPGGQRFRAPPSTRSGQ